MNSYAELHVDLGTASYRTTARPPANLNASSRRGKPWRREDRPASRGSQPRAYAGVRDRITSRVGEVALCPLRSASHGNYGVLRSLRSAGIEVIPLGVLWRISVSAQGATLVSAWRNGEINRKAFVSHSHRDHQQAKDLAEALRGCSVESWLDEWEIQPGDSLVQKVHQGLRDCGVFVGLLPPLGRGTLTSGAIIHRPVCWACR